MEQTSMSTETSTSRPGLEHLTSQRRRIRLINEAFDPTLEGGNLMPLAACDCDNHCTAHCVIGDIQVDACGIWG